MSSITLLFSGDFAPLLLPGQMDEDHFADIEQYISSCDLHITNLECPLTLSEDQIEKSGPRLRAHPGSVNLLKQAGVKIACLANNHIFDYGEAGILDTVNYCNEEGIDTVGTVSLPDQRPHWLIKEKKGKKIGFLNYCEHEFSVRENGLLGSSGYDPVFAYYDIQYLKPKVDRLIVIYHGGNEYYPLPRPNLRQNFKYLADIGADAVIGHHTHVYSGYEIYNDKPLIYSLGNFFFPLEGEPEEWHLGLLCLMRIDDELNFELEPVIQCWNNHEVKLPNQQQKEAIMDKLNRLSVIISNDIELRQSWKEYVMNNGAGLEGSFLFPSRIDRLMRKVGVSLHSQSQLYSIINIIRNKSLNNLLIDSLKAKIK